MQSHNYELGVSGWKMHSNGILEVNGKIRAVMDDPVDKPATPFAVDGDQVILSQVSIDEGSISPVWGVRTTINAAGQRVFAGVGAGLGCMCEGGYTGATGDKQDEPGVKIDFTVDVSKGLDQISKLISTTELAQSIESLKFRIEHEHSSRVCADDTLSCRISAVEAGLNSLRAKQ
ncbi:host specificity protein J [Pseudomonas amygdali]|uniref:host specificity protein J n=1 Tax=Pseudomonas amygdali TaxID=47877 RepID=UPI0035322089